jgi:hypothetical protein
MIRLVATKQDERRGNYHPQTRFICPFPECEEENSFYSVSPDRCHGCMRHYDLNFRKLMEDLDYRRKFHQEIGT